LSLCASSTISASYSFLFDSTYDPDHLNRFENSVFLRVPVSLLSYTVRGAEFFVIYCDNSPCFVRETNKLIATTDLPVHGHHSTISTFLLRSEDFLARLSAVSYTIFWSSIMTNS
jgi:hypothetical protein